MSNQFKAGDLAMLKSSGAPELVGSVVELIEYLGDGTVVRHEGRMIINDLRARIWWVSLTSGQLFENLDGHKASDGFCAEYRLMPLRGDFTPEQQKAKEAEPC